MAASDALGPQWEKHEVKGSEVVPGDRLDIGGKNRVARVHPYKGQIMARVETRGARSATVQKFDPESVTRVYRKRQT